MTTTVDKVANDYSDIKVLFNVTFRSLNWLRAWPTAQRSTLQTFLFNFHIQYWLWFSVSCITKAIWSILNFEILAFAEALGPALTFISTMLKFASFTSNHQKYHEILCEMETFFKTGMYN